MISILTALCLITIIALLTWHLIRSVHSTDIMNQTNFTCPPNPCPLTTITSTISTQSSTNESPSTTINTMQTSASVR